MKLPNSRNTDIVVQDLGKELLVYDLAAEKAYCLNETLKAVYQACDGRSFSELKRRNFGFTDDIILLSLQALSRENLLSEKYESGVSRRTLLMRATSATIALPVIAGLVAPSAASARSSQACMAGGSPCDLNDPGACCTQICLINGGNPICFTTCLPGGSSCDLNDPGACCSQRCLINSGNPICFTPCLSRGTSCDLNDPGACCSQRCLINHGFPICD